MQLAENYYQMACAGLTVQLERPTVMTVCALLLLFSYCAHCPRGNAAWRYLSLAVRLAFDLQLNKEVEPGSGISQLERDVRRNMWWACYVSDRYANVGSGTPILIKDEDCLVKLPDRDFDDMLEDIDLEAGQRPDDNAVLQIGIMSCTDCVELE
eukprot:jgi/Hompol1/5681/HPOL_002022-RA